jgi:Uma2 family endonuclease
MTDRNSGDIRKEIAQKHENMQKGIGDIMGLAEAERRKDEKINGVIYDMSPAPDFRHGIVNSNIHTMIKYGLKNSMCLVSIENLDFKYHPEENDDYLCPDVMIICDRKHLKGGTYSGVPKFIAETLSPSTAKKDKTEKKDIYEKAGIEEYWIVSPQGFLEIYYLEDGKYVLEQSYMLQRDKEEAHYNAETEIILRAFPNIKMTLGEIFEGVD